MSEVEFVQEYSSQISEIIGIVHQESEKGDAFLLSTTAPNFIIVIIKDSIRSQMCSLVTC